ncbi:hypothetical protein ACP70R_018611 [Stipagrostis hirtigluma subsp. patula]
MALVCGHYERRGGGARPRGGLLVQERSESVVSRGGDSGGQPPPQPPSRRWRPPPVAAVAGVRRRRLAVGLQKGSRLGPSSPHSPSHSSSTLFFPHPATSQIRTFMELSWSPRNRSGHLRLRSGLGLWDPPPTNSYWHWRHRHRSTPAIGGLPCRGLARAPPAGLGVCGGHGPSCSTCWPPLPVAHGECGSSGGAQVAPEGGGRRNALLRKAAVLLHWVRLGHVLSKMWASQLQGGDGLRVSVGVTKRACDAQASSSSSMKANKSAD